ncbi:hypothetical protein K439DRAFT_1182913 [Ramaria rubella]|nr:hypothetical protein K439DRAFT_1182913 [Ramaria rubella]
MKEWEKERREREKAEEKELRRAQELDFQRSGRSRKLSDVGYGANYPTYSAPVPAGYTRTRSRSRARRDSAGQDELTRAMAEVAFEKAESEAMWGREKERRNSNAGRPRRVSVNERSRKVSTGEYERTRKTSGTPYPVSGYPTASGYPASTYSSYGAPPSPGRTVSQRMSPYTSGGGLPSAAGPSARRSYSDRASPYMGGGGLPPAEGTGPVYPPGHIYAGRPIPGMQGNNLGNATSTYRAPSPGLRRASSPAFLRGSSPRRGSLQLESPAGFTRQPSMAVPYTYFDPVLVLSDLNGLYQQLPTMPPVLVPHDVWLEDWVRCIEDIARAWVGKMPDRNMSTKKPHNVVAQLIDIWNASFFSLRGVELVLFRGRQRRSGPLAGRYDSRLGGEDFSDDESDTISSVSSDSDVENMFYGGTQSRYGVGGNSWLTDSREARRVRKAAKKLLEKQSRKRHEREKERGSGFSLYLTCANDGQPSRVPYAAATSAYLG